MLEILNALIHFIEAFALLSVFAGFWFAIAIFCGDMLKEPTYRTNGTPYNDREERS